MKHFLLAFFLLPVCLGAQNLVPNPSFETVDSCPTFAGQLYRATPWYIAENTPDYYNACCNATFPSLGVPSNDFGFRYAASGNAYCGIWTYIAYPPPDYREKIGVQLIEPLKVGTRYYASLKLSSVSSHTQDSNGGSSGIGMLFSTKKYDLSELPPTNNFCQFYTDSVVTDTIDWSLIKGSFIADSAYQYLTIGNFFDNAHTDTVRYWYINGNNELSSYYFIDDICVTPDSAGCTFNDGINNQISNSSFQVYPNPANDFINIQINSITSYSIRLYNSLGQSVYVNNDANAKNKNYQINVTCFAQGFYFFQIKTKQKIFIQKILITH